MFVIGFASPIGTGTYFLVEKWARCSHLHYLDKKNRAPFQYPLRSLIVSSCKVSKPWDSYSKLYHRSGISQAPRERCCRCACQISKRYEHFKTRSRAFDTLRNLMIRQILKQGPGIHCYLSIRPMTSWPIQHRYPLSSYRDIHYKDKTVI